MAGWCLAAVPNSADLEFTMSLHFRNVRDMVPATRPALPAPQLVATGASLGAVPLAGPLPRSLFPALTDHRGENRLEVIPRLRGR